MEIQVLVQLGGCRRGCLRTLQRKLLTAATHRGAPRLSSTTMPLRAAKIFDPTANMSPPKQMLSLRYKPDWKSSAQSGQGPKDSGGNESDDSSSDKSSNKSDNESGSKSSEDGSSGESDGEEDSSSNKESNSVSEEPKANNILSCPIPWLPEEVGRIAKVANV